MNRNKYKLDRAGILLSILFMFFSGCEDNPTEPDDIQSVEATMIYVEGGSFNMGNADGEIDEQPLHKVQISSFYINQFELKQEQWNLIMDSNPSSYKVDNHPVEQVSWFEAVEFCNKLSEEAGLTPCYTINGSTVTCDFDAGGYRLPTEAEWEFAASGGTKPDNTLFSGGNDADLVAWFSDNSYGSHHSVGQKRPNELNLYDMSGNVNEWCWDWYGSAYYDASPLTDPRGPSSGVFRVYRGGSWDNDLNDLIITVRNENSPSADNKSCGFRICRSA